VCVFFCFSLSLSPLLSPLVLSVLSLQFFVFGGSMDAQRALLDQLMGKHRNLSADERAKKQKNFDDDTVCQFYNCSFCPHDLFRNTKSDLGECPLEHDEKLQDEYREAARTDPELRKRTELRFLREIERLLVGPDARIRRQKNRIDMENGPVVDPAAEEAKAQKAQLDEQAEALQQQMLELGEQGKIEESQALLKLVEELRQQSAAIVVSLVKI
jgi:LUC7 N_terminus